MASIKKAKLKNGKVRYRVRVRVKDSFRSRTFTNKAEAEHWGADTEKEIYRIGMSAHEQSKGRTFWSLIDKYCEEVLPGKATGTQRGQNKKLMFWRAFLGDIPIIEVIPPLIGAVKQSLKALKSSTVNGYLSALSRVFTIAVKEWQWVESNPVSRVFRLSEPPGRVRFLSDSERARLLFYAKISSNKHLHAVLTLALFTGARKSEIRTLTWAQVDMKRREIYVEETKNGERRTLRLYGRAFDVMKDLFERRAGSAYCFPSRDGLRPVDFRYAWENLREKAGLTNFKFHDLRHTAASYLALNGATLNDIGEIIGHKSMKSSKRYTHLTEGHASRLQEKMNQSIT